MTDTDAKLRELYDQRAALLDSLDKLEREIDSLELAEDAARRKGLERIRQYDPGHPGPHDITHSYDPAQDVHPAITLAIAALEREGYTVTAPNQHGQVKVTSSRPQVVYTRCSNCGFNYSYAESHTCR
jgi:hypothetical protein